MNEVQCLGTEKSLWSCPFKNITQEDCKHTEDAAVRCNVPYMGYENLVRSTGSWGGPGACVGRAPNLSSAPQRAPRVLRGLGQGLPWELGGLRG